MAGKFHCTAALRFTAAPGRRVVQAFAVAFQIGHFRFNGFLFPMPQASGQKAQIVQQRHSPALSEFLQQRFDLGPCREFVLRMQRIRLGEHVRP